MTDVGRAFDAQAAAFERAPIQTDPGLLSALVRFAAFPPGTRVLDAGCGPGLVAEALLAADPSLRVLGCDLSGAMVERARARCARFGARAEFVRAPLEEVADDLAAGRREPAGGAISRFVLHHAPDPAAFVAAQARALRAGGVLVLADHVADPDPALAEWHRRLEVMRDGTHARNLSGGRIVDLLAATGLADVRYEEHPLGTDFEEWFARGTPTATREECRAWLLDPRGGRSRAWRPRRMPDGNVWIDGVIGYARGVVP